MQLALASDIRIADAGARFAVPVAKLGLMVDHWTLSRLVDAMGFGAARHLVLTAEILRGDDGFRLGFVQELVEARGAAVAAAHHLADRVATLAPLSIRGSKLGLNRLERDHDDSDYRVAFRTAWESEDLAEGQRAFAEQRSPVFKGQ
jgi:enoyl-CoA hydratase